MRKYVPIRIQARRGGGGILALMLALFAASPRARGEGGPGEIDALRDLEGKITRTIEEARKAFVFIEGGSGFLVSADGYILTNEHVVGGKGETIVQLTTGRNYGARVVGHDPEGDVALLKIAGESPFPYLELGDSSKLRVGDRVIALGDPFLLASLNLFLGGAPPDLEPSASFGVVSALHRYSDTYSDAIQVDVAVNRGNSGGPLITLDGKAVGINGKIETRFAIGINSGVGYAVPSNQIKNFLEALKAADGGKVEHGTIAGLYVDERSEGGEGLTVRRVEAGSTADRAGFQKGDRIVSVEGLPVPTRNRYKGVLSTYPIGSELTVALLRDDGPSDGDPESDAPDDSGPDDRAPEGVVLTEGAQTTSADRPGEGVALEIRVSLEPKGPAYLGIKMEDGPSGGVLVKDLIVGGAAETAGIEVGDVILLFRGQRVGKVEDLAKLVGEAAPGDDASVVVMRDGKPVRIDVLLGTRGSGEAGRE